jgi:hypothetical protein
MNRIALPFLAALLAAGCAASTPAPSTSATKAEKVAVAMTDGGSDQAGSTERREVGDHVTFAFSGSYRKSPITLTQRVISRTEDAIEIEYTFVENGKSETMRTATSLAGETTGAITRVVRVGDDGGTEPLSVEAFEARMGETAAQTDQNEALLDERQTKVTVGGDEILATTSVYQVKLGDQSATLETTASPDFVWGDLGGKITTADGAVFFSAELVDAGGAHGAQALLDEL